MQVTTPEWSTTGDAHATTLHPRILGTKVIDKELTKDTSLKVLKPVVEGGASEAAVDWLRTLRDYHVKYAYYTVLHRADRRQGSHPNRSEEPDTLSPPQEPRGRQGHRARAKDAMFWPGINSDIQQV